MFCDRNCLNCQYIDCICDDITMEEFLACSDRDKVNNYTKKYLKTKRYNNTEKGKENLKKYRRSEKYKQYQRDYNKTEKRRSYMKEYNRLYYLRRKEQSLCQN